MLLAFLLNGLCPFGLRILAGMGAGGEYIPVYLFYWYLAGLVFGLLWAFRSGQRIAKTAILIGSVMALASVGGQLFMGLAMAHGAPGNVVYMLAQGASICVVAFGGLVLFKEKLGLYGKAGIAAGLLAAVLLGVWS
jgi:multidrug transporter EmrE-like cation transporter